MTNFCKEANIAESDQLDLAEFIVAARYLGTEANDDQLMNVFMDMEETNVGDAKDPKQLIKDLMKKVDEEYGFGGDDEDDKDDDDADEQTKNLRQELMADNPLQAFEEDNQWQGEELEKIFTANEQDQNLKIALNLLQTTALTASEIAEITGVDKEQLQALEDEEYDDESDEEEEEVSVTVTETESSKKEVKVSAVASGGGGGGGGGVTIKASDLGKSVALTKDDLGLLKALIDGGKDKVAEKAEDSLRLLTKFNAAININPKGHMKRAKTLAKLKLDKVVDDKKEKEVKLPTKYRVVIHPGIVYNQ